jgi:hypothetical protein
LERLLRWFKELFLKTGNGIAERMEGVDRVQSCTDATEQLSQSSVGWRAGRCSLGAATSLLLPRAREK